MKKDIRGFERKEKCSDGVPFFLFTWDQQIGFRHLHVENRSKHTIQC